MKSYSLCEESWWIFFVEMSKTRKYESEELDKAIVELLITSNPLTQKSKEYFLSGLRCTSSFFKYFVLIIMCLFDLSINYFPRSSTWFQVEIDCCFRLRLNFCLCLQFFLLFRSLNRFVFSCYKGGGVYRLVIPAHSLKY